MGFAANQGGTCAVAAMRRLVHRSDARPLIGFLLATSVGGLVCLPVAWLLGGRAHLPVVADVGVGLLTGSALLGVGAFVNGACLLGSLWRLGNGESRLLALPLGLSFGYLVATRLAPFLLPAGRAAPRPSFGIADLLLVGAFLLIALAALVWLSSREGDLPPGRWRLTTSMIVIGASGALLFAVQPGWSYADAIRRGVAPPMLMMLAGSGGLVAALATVVGAITSAATSRAFALHRPRFRDIARSVVGGSLMAFGAALVPGGNDALLLAGIPSGSASAMVAFATMNATILLLVAIGSVRTVGNH